MTLTQTAILVKQIINISIVALVLSISSFIGYKIWYAYYLAHLPPVEEKPDTKFGVLPPPDFPKSAVSSSNYTYTLDTITGGLPKLGADPGFEKVIKVYFVTQAFATLLSPERSQGLAEKFGITSKPEILSETKYRFEDINKTLLVDLDNGNFSYTNDATVSAKVNLEEDDKLIADFKQILATQGIFKDDLKESRTKVVLFTAEGTELAPTQNRSDASIAQVSLWPASIDKKPIVTPNFNKSLINAIVLGGASILDNYLSLDFNYYPIDLSTFATYQIKTPEEAFNDLKAGKGAVIIEPDKPQVSISSVYLGYYLPEKYSPYLQPVFIFEGPHFAAYISAISGNSQPTATQN